MKKKWVISICIAIVLILILGIIYINTSRPKQIENRNFKIVTTFYPIYIMTTNITQGANNIEVVNMADINTGCLHNYTLSTADMKKIENTNVLIQNGLGLENFINKILNTYSNIKVIDSSKNIVNTIKENEETNPHVWTSLTNYITQVQEITNQLKEINPENAAIYQQNSDIYVKKLREIKLKYDTQLSNLNGKRAICLNEGLSYLCRDIGMELTLVETDHDETSLSAEAMKNLINKMKLENIKIILVDINDNLSNAQTLEKETGAKIYELNSGLTGDLRKDEYLDLMDSNFEILKQIQN